MELDEDSIDNGKSGSSNNAMKAIIKIIKAVFRTIKSIIEFIASHLALIGYITLIVGIIVMVVIVIAMIVSAVTNGIYENGKYTPGAGANGSSFYGERYILNDYTATKEEIADIYKELSYGLITTSINNNFITISNLPENYQESSDALAISLNFAKSISTMQDLGNPLSYYTGGIDHYGLTPLEQESFVQTAVDYFENKSYIKQNVTKEQIALKLKQSFDNEYSYMKNVCKKYIIKDYIFDGNNGLIDIVSKDYLGMAFMPKEDLTITHTEFAFIATPGNEIAASFNYVSNGTVTELASDTADSTWFEDGIVKKSLEVDPGDYSISKFTALDMNNMDYLKDGKSLFTIMRENKLNVYFNDTLIVNENTTSVNLLNNFKCDKYEYISSIGDGNYYIVADILTEN